jgi:transposase
MNSMNLIELGRIAADERKSFQYLCNKFIELSCPNCGQQVYYFMSRQRLRCKICCNDFSPLKYTKFSEIKISASRWLILIKLFELSVSARKASVEMNMSYKTTLKAFDLLRKAIDEELSRCDEVLKGEIELDESYFGGKRKGKRGRGAAGKTIVFGILERGGKVSVEIVKNVTAETLMKETMKKVRRGSIVYTDKWKGYDSLMFSGYKHLNIDHKYKFKEGKVFINGVEGFWSFAKERLIRYHGISRHKFILYLREMEWRYNNRNEDLFEMLVYYMLGRNELRITKKCLSYNK